MDFITDFDEDNNADILNREIKPSTIIPNNSTPNLHFISKIKRDELSQQKQNKQKAEEQKRLREIQRKKRLFTNPKSIQRKLKPIIINKEKETQTEQIELKEIKVRQIICKSI